MAFNLLLNGAMLALPPWLLKAHIFPCHHSTYQNLLPCHHSNNIFFNLVFKLNRIYFF